MRKDWGKLKFGRTDGTDGENWNTIRLGVAWTKRVKVGDEIPLHTTAGDVYGRAVVKRIVSGPKDEMLRKHSRHNHLMNHDGIKGDAAYEKMVKLLPRLYGSMIYNNHDRITVIYLDRV